MPWPMQFGWRWRRRSRLYRDLSYRYVQMIGPAIQFIIVEAGDGVAQLLG